MNKVMFLAILLMSTIALAQGPHLGKGGPGGPGGHPPHEKGAHLLKMHDEMLEAIGVPESQRAEIRSMAHETHKKMLDIQFKIKEERLAMKSEIEKGNPDKAKLQKSVQKIADLRREQVLLMENQKIEMLFKLSPEQRKKAIEFMQDRRKMMMERFGAPAPDDDD